MTLEEFAIKAGVTLVESDNNDWGGKFGYTDEQYPRTTIIGFRTKASAYRHWMKSTFGDRTGKLVIRLLKLEAK